MFEDITYDMQIFDEADDPHGPLTFMDRPIDPRTVVLGEVGLAGEVRAVSQMEVRIKESARLGFTRCLIPKTNAAQLQKTAKMDICKISSLKEMLDYLF